MLLNKWSNERGLRVFEHRLGNREGVVIDRSGVYFFRGCLRCGWEVVVIHDIQLEVFDVFEEF